MKKYHILLILLNMKKIVALKIEGEKDAINEKNSKKTLVIINDIISLHFNFFKTYKRIDEKTEI
jgi:hypothetical protein